MSGSEQIYVAAAIPERFVEVDAARLLLIISQFARHSTNSHPQLKCAPSKPYIGYFTPEYYLHKLDFLLRYPSYFVYELTELYRLGLISEDRRSEVIAVVNEIISKNEPQLKTTLYRRFWRGAYERLDDVESWWYARELVYTSLEPRGEARPWKYYFLTQLGQDTAKRLVSDVAHARWYADRIQLLHRYFGELSAADIKELQYSHPEYRQAQLDEYIPDLALRDIAEQYERVFGDHLQMEISA
jgi:hypothetical protein